MIPNIHVTEGNNERTKFKTWKCVGGVKKNLLFVGIKSNSRIYDSKTGRKNNNTRGGRQNNNNNNNRETKEHNRECVKSLPPTLLWLEEAVTHRESRGKEPSRATTGDATHTHTVHVPPPSTPRTTLLLGGSAAINDSNSHSSLLACGRLHPDCCCCCCCCASSSSAELGIGNRPRQPDAQRLSTLLRC